MTKQKSTIKFRPITFVENEPDQMWQAEVSHLLPWLFGKGADIGCGLRTIKSDSIRVDIDPNVRPDVQCTGDILPFKDEELDYITSVHSFEHFDDQHKLMTEWLRVIKVGGIIGIVHPDVEFTKRQKPLNDNPSLQENPFNLHYHEHTRESLLKKFKECRDLPFKVIDSGVACGNWSFYIILEKT